MDNYSDFIKKSESEKIVLADLRYYKRISSLEYDAVNNVYYKDVDTLVENVKIFYYSNNNSTFLTKSNSISLNEGEYFYDHEINRLYFFEEFNDIDIDTIVEFKLLFSNAPITLSHDLTDTGFQVSYSPRIISTPKFKNSMATLNKDNSLIGSGTVVLQNNDGFFDDLYDKVIWEEKSVNIYSYNRNLKPSQAKRIFRGKITSKNWSSTNISFNVKDDLFSLNKPLDLNRYDTLNNEEDSERYKRIVYGKVQNLLMQCLDKTTGGFNGTGNIKGFQGESYIKGDGTLFLSELNIDDKIIVDDFEYKIKSIKSNTLIVTDEIEKSFSGKQLVIESDTGNTNFNRNYQLTDHKIKKWSTTISNITTPFSKNKFYVTNVNGFKAGDLIEIDNQKKVIKRISGNLIFLTTNLKADPFIGQPLEKKEVFDVFYNDNKILDTDYTINQDSEGCKLTLSKDAEFNSVRNKKLNIKLYTKQGSNKVWSSLPTLGSIDIPYSYNMREQVLGKYITIPRENGNNISFWFGDNAPDQTTAYPEPDVDGSDSVKIELQNRIYTMNEIAELFLDHVMIHTEEIEGYISSITEGVSTTISFEYIEPNEDTVLFTSGNNTTTWTKNHIQTGNNALGNINLTEILKNGDYVKGINQSTVEYKQILEVKEQTIILRKPINDEYFSFINYKNIESINNDSKVYSSCYGKTNNGEESGNLIDNFADIVIDLLEQAGLTDFIDYDSFDNIRDDLYYTPSLKIPEGFDSDPDSVIDIISQINKTINGSLVLTNELKLSYKLIDSDVDNLPILSDTQCTKWRVNSDAFDIYQRVVGKYNHQDYNKDADDEFLDIKTYTSDFVKAYIDNNKENTRRFLLIEENDIEEATEKYLMLNALSSTSISVEGSLNLAKYNLGDLVLLDFDRLYIALGSTSNKKRVGIISNINNTGSKVNLTVTDLGSLYTRSCVLCDDDVDDYDVASEDDRITNSYITDNNGLINNDEKTNNTNLIS